MSTPRQIINKFLLSANLHIALNNNALLDMPIDDIIDDELLELYKPISLTDVPIYDIIIWAYHDDLKITVLKTNDQETIIKQYIDIYPYMGVNWKNI